MKRNRIVITTFAALIMLAGVAANAATKLRVATEGAYPPFNFIDTSGKVGGFDVDIGLALCEKMKVECDVVAQDWDGIIPGLLAKKYDMIVASMYITDERKKQVSFTDPYYAAAITHVAPKGAGITDFTDAGMKGKAIGVQTATIAAEFVQNKYPSADIRVYPTQDEANLELSNGRLDLVVADMLPMVTWLKSADATCCELVGQPITDPKIVGDGAGIAVRQQDNDLREALNKALKEILADGTYKKINDKYFPIDVYTMSQAGG